MTLEAGLKRESHEWLETSDSVVTPAEAITVPISVAVRALAALPPNSKDSDTEARMNLLLGLNVAYAQGVEESETIGYVCQASGTLEDEGEVYTVETWDTKPMGAPTVKRDLEVRVGIGVLPSGYAKWRATLYPVATLGLAPGADAVLAEAGVELLGHAFLGRLNKKTCDGAYKGILAFGPTVMWDLTSETPVSPVIGLRLAVLTQKHLLGPTVGI